MSRFIKNIIKKKIFLFQKILFYISNFIFSLILKRNSIDWTLGVKENCKNVFYFSKLIKKSYSVCFYQDLYYNLSYDYSLKPGKFNYIKIIFIGPILFSYLLIKSKGFIYFSRTSFFNPIGTTNGSFEWKKIKDNKKKLAFFYSGGDIRSHNLTMKLEKKVGLDSASRYFSLIHPEIKTKKYKDNTVVKWKNMQILFLIMKLIK